MSDPVNDLGLSCPEEGKFYICADKPSRFIGCCTTNPCKTEDGACPPENLRASSFDVGSFHGIPPQSCVSNHTDIKWYTCTGKVPFLGCCDVNACDEGVCPTESLQAASLSDDEEKAKVFLLGNATETSTSTTSASPALATETKSSGGGGAPFSHAAGAAIGVGSTLAVALVLGLIVWAWMKRKRNRTTEAEPQPAAKSATTQTSPTSPGSPSERGLSAEDKGKAAVRTHRQRPHPRAYHQSHDPYRNYYHQQFPYPGSAPQTPPFYMSAPGQGYPSPHPLVSYHPSMSLPGFPQYHVAPTPPAELSSSPSAGQNSQVQTGQLPTGQVPTAV